ncbi:MAG: hypothetical protein ABW148_04325 [Sedimenticola sp.]
MSILKIPTVLCVLLLGFSAQSHADLLTNFKQVADHIFPWKKRASDLVKKGVRNTEVKGVPFKWFDHKWGRLIVNAEDRKFLGVPLTLAFFLALDSI